MNSQISIVVALSAVLSVIAISAATPFVSHKDCNNVPRGTFIANPGNCSQYIQCNGLRSTLGECPLNTFFNPEVLSCDKSRHACKTKAPIGNTEDSEFQSSTTAAPLTTSSAVTKTRPAVTTRPALTTTSAALSATMGRPVCTAWLDQQFPHPENCEYYYYCIGGFLSVRRCYFGFGWDMDRQRCVPLQHANCFKN